MRVTVLAPVALALLLPVAAPAQTYVSAECRALVSLPAPKFDDEQHGLWYRRFWNGDCSGLGFFCSPGTPNWGAAVGQIVSRTPGADRAAVTAKACRLGRLIGLEWARDNSIRKIDTSEISRFYSELDAATDIEAALAEVEREARADLAR